MAFSASVPEIVYLGPGQVVARGTYTNGAGDTGGDIAHGLKIVRGVKLSQIGAAVTSKPVYNETLPLGDWTAVTIVTTNNGDGTYEIYGEL